MLKPWRFLILALIACGLATVHAQTHLTESPVNLSDSETTSGWHVARMDADGVLHVVWEEVSMADSNLLYRQRTPDGTWSDTFNLTANVEMFLTVSPRLFPRADGSVCMAFAGATILNDPSTLGLYTTCDLPTTTFDMARRIIGNQRDHAVAFGPGGQLQSVYTVGAGELIFANTDTALSDPNFLATGTQLAVDGDGAFHVVYERLGTPQSVEHTWSTNGGLTWNGPSRLSDDNLMDLSNAGPTDLIIGPNGTLHAAWFSGGALQYSRFVAGKWEPIQTLALLVMNADMNNGAASFTLTLDTDGLAHIVWGGRATHYLRQLPDGRWTRPYRLDNRITAGGPGPSLAVDARGIGHLVYSDSATRADVFYTTFDTRPLAAPAALVEPSADGRTFREVRTLVVPQAALMREPTTSGGFVGLVTAEQPFTVIGSAPSGLWLQVEPAFGEAGWVPAMLTEGEATEDGPTTVNARADQITVAVPEDARALPGLFDAPDGTLLGAAPLGETFVAVGRTETGNYLLVENSAGERYWVGTETVALQDEQADINTLPITAP